MAGTASGDALPASGDAIVADIAPGSGNVPASGAATACDAAPDSGDTLPTFEVTIPAVPIDYVHRKAWIIHERQNSIQRYAQISKRLNRIPDSNDMTNAQLRRADRFLAFLEHDFEITPWWRDEANLDQALRIIFDDERFHFPENLKTRAARLYQEWEDAEWGIANTIDHYGEQRSQGGRVKEDKDDVQSAAGVRATHSSRKDGASDYPAVISIRLPPRDHPIWGVNGIMHGIAVKGSKSKSKILDRRYQIAKRSARVIGNNSLQPGDWFASQLVALYRGAHGARMAGIHGDTTRGTISVVVSGKYSHVDLDDGDVIYYSGPNSENNQDPNCLPDGGGTEALMNRSINTQNPVRVLRSANRRSVHAPSVGVRYDGLYTIVRQEEPRLNSKGGLFTRWVLKRQPNQESLDSIKKRSPTRQQKTDFEHINRLW